MITSGIALAIVLIVVISHIGILVYTPHKKFDDEENDQ